MITLYRPGASLVHRAPAWTKLLGLMLTALAVSLLPAAWWMPLGLACFVLFWFLLAGLGITEFARQLWTLRWLVIGLGVFLVIFNGWQDATIALSRISLIIVLASLISLTTRVSDMLDALTRALGPLRRIRINPERVALTMSLTVSAVPTIAGIAARVREAQIARGARPSVRVWAVPMLVLTLKHADELADALTARGVE